MISVNAQTKICSIKNHQFEPRKITNLCPLKNSFTTSKEKPKNQTRHPMTL
jgi:hypothetical protein